MKFAITFFLSFGVVSSATAEWKQKAWQCFGEVAVISVNGTKTKQEYSARSPINHYYHEISKATAMMNIALEENAKVPNVCNFAKFLSDHIDDDVMAYGYWFKIGEDKRHDFWLPINWIPYDRKVRQIMNDQEISNGEYRVCNFSCKPKRINPDNQDIVFHE